MSSSVSRPGWLMKLGNQKRTNETKKDRLLRVPQKSSALQNAKKPNTWEERFYKKSLQEIIRSAYEKSPHIQRPALHGAKNSSRLCRFFDSLVSESPECKSSQQVQTTTTTKRSFKNRRELLHTKITQHFPTACCMQVGFSSGGKVLEGHA